MQLWAPAPGEPALLEWWRPLLAVARLARVEQISWPIHLDEFSFVGRVDRKRRLALWVYRHGLSRGFIHADAAGGTYEWVEHRSGPSPGRFKQIDVWAAVWRCGLSNVVEPVWYEEPPRTRYEPDLYPGPSSDLYGESLMPPEPSVGSPAPSRRRTRRHLRLVRPS